MNIIIKTPNSSGAYPSIQSWNSLPLPENYAIVPDTLDMKNFYEYKGFVTLTIEEVEYTKKIEKPTEDGVEIIDETYTVDTVTSYKSNTEAWDAWIASLPEPTEPKPSQLDLIEAQVTYTAMMTDTLLEV